MLIQRCLSILFLNFIFEIFVNFFELNIFSLKTVNTSRFHDEDDEENNEIEEYIDEGKETGIFRFFNQFKFRIYKN